MFIIQRDVLVSINLYSRYVFLGICCLKTEPCWGYDEVTYVILGIFTSYLWLNIIKIIEYACAYYMCNNL